MVFSFGIYNSLVTKQSYKTELCIMMSQIEVLTLKFFEFFELLTQCEKTLI